jgi:16S rRNA (cytosine967-C5)-methyltransferase
VGARLARATGVGNVGIVPANARLLALDALVRIEEGAYAHIVVPEMLRASSLDDRDRAFATDLAYGTVRAQRRIDDLLARVSKRPVRRLDRPVRAGLRLGAYQLLHDVPPHAAVSATVDAVAARSPRARGFTNGVLRALTRLGPPWPEPDAPAVALSYPDWLVARLIDDLGATDALDALRTMNEPAAVTLRPNPRAVAPDALEAELRSLAIDTTRGALVPDAMVVRGLGDPARLAAVRDGRATPQDQASQAVTALVGAVEGEWVADVAAAPGGKAGALAERVGPTGGVVALDVDAGRSRMVAGAAARLGLPWLHVAVADARRPPLAAARFDRVLVDAPCSGLGVLRRRADARWRLTPETVDELVVLQREILAASAALVRAGGVLVYSVCTLTAAETQGIDEWAAEHLSDFGAVAPTGAPWRALGRGALLLPQAAGTDGMYALALRREAG